MCEKKISSVITEVSKNPKLISYIESCMTDHWSETQFAGYVFMGNKQKGKYGEEFIKLFLENIGFKPNLRENASHDAMIDSYKVEYKFSLAMTSKQKNIILKDSFIINHVSVGKDWERLIFMGINPDDDHRLFWFSKKDFTKMLKKENIFKKQQGGNSIDNDDYMCSAANLLRLMELSKGIEEW